MAIFKKNGNWYIDYYCDLVRFRQKIGPSKKQAEQMLAIRQAEILQGRFDIKAHRKSVLFKELTEHYLEYSKATKRSYKRDGNSIKHLLAFFGSYRINQIKTEMVERYKIQRRNEIMTRPKYLGRDPRDIPMATINREVVCLKHMFNMGIKWGKAEHNPVKGVKLFKEDNVVERLLSDMDVDALLAASSEHLKDIILIALNTGMRLGEILNLKWEQVDLHQDYITVIRTKSGKQRKIPINQTVHNLLIDHPRDGIFIFHRDGKPYGAVKTAFNNALRRSGVGYCRFHDLRHTFATKLVLSGVSLPVVKELLGHASIETTMRYAHPTPESKKQAVAMLDWQKVALDRHYLDTGTSSAGDRLALISSK